MKNSVKKEEYLAKIVHDLKTPTIAQIKALEFFLSEAADKINSEEKELIELTLSSCIYMRDLIENFCNIDKLKCCEIKFNYETFNIVELTNEILKDCSVLIRCCELQVELFSKSEITVRADKIQIRRVIENILSNALKYAYKNTKINISIKKEGNILCFEAKNSGPYIEKKALDEIFKKYGVCEVNSASSGFGLGLYLSKEIIDSHFGKMIAKSTSDNINIFGFIIPS